MNTKSLATSKTALANALISILVCFAPGGAAWVQAHPTETVVIINVVNILLRTVTHKKIHLFADDQKDFRIPVVVGFFLLANVSASCQPALFRITADPTPRLLVPVDSTPVRAASAPADSRVINPAVYRKTSDADLVRALETMTPIK